jgi:uncharacterized protein (TIRG00374 family)
LALRVAALGAAFALVVRGVRWREVLETLRHANLALLWCVVGLNGCMMSVKAMRLRSLANKPEIRLTAFFNALLTSSALNNVMPLRGGGVARLWMLERSAGMTKTAAVGTAIVESLVEILALGGLAVVASWRNPAQGWARAAASGVFVLAVASLIVLFRLARRGRAADALVGGGSNPRVRRLRAALSGILRRIEPGVRALGSRGVVLSALLLSVLAWACEAAMVMVCARAIQLRVTPDLAVVVLLGINLALALPSTPASVGPFEGGVVLVLTLAGWAKGSALAFALLYHAVQVVPVTVAGLTMVASAGLVPRGRSIPPPSKLSRAEQVAGEIEPN